MFIDQRHKGLATFRAARAERKEIAILAKGVAESNPNKTPEECKALALEIRQARQRTARADADRSAQQKKRQQKTRNKRKNHQRSHNAPTSSQRKAKVTVVNKMAN